eukprot:COSAG02_NODE_2923_length_7743_cov_6.813448_3_plen_92_part_00
MTKNIVSRDQDAIRPLEEISNGKISRTECDKRVAAHTVPGTPCLVQLPHGPKASSITNYSRSRNGIAVALFFPGKNLYDLASPLHEQTLAC